MKSRMSVLAGIVMMGFGVFGLGCYARAGTYVATESAVVYDTSPMLVAVEPGIWVVSRQPTAIYYVNDTYWTSRGDTWYRSSSWNGGWISVDVNIVPVTIVRRDSTRYAHYEPPRGVPSRLLPPGHRETPGVRRGQAHDHRRAKHNEMGTTLPASNTPAHHKQVKRGPHRGR
jgi:hypothetical protein